VACHLQPNDLYLERDEHVQQLPCGDLFLHLVQLLPYGLLQELVLKKSKK
jgi:hypothetical protein